MVCPSLQYIYRGIHFWISKVPLTVADLMGVLSHLEGCQPLMWVLFGKNVCENVILVVRILHVGKGTLLFVTFQ